MTYITDIRKVIDVVAANRWALKNIRRLPNNDIFIATYSVRTQNKALVQSVFETLQEDTDGAFYLHEVLDSSYCRGVDIVYSIDQRMLNP